MTLEHVTAESVYARNMQSILTLEMLVHRR